MTVATEDHYSIAEVAELWAVTKDTVRRIFADLPCVLRLGHRQTKNTRKYVTLRIPEMAVTAQHARLQKRGQQ